MKQTVVHLRWITYETTHSCWSQVAWIVCELNTSQRRNLFCMRWAGGLYRWTIDGEKVSTHFPSKQVWGDSLQSRVFVAQCEGYIHSREHTNRIFRLHNQHHSQTEITISNRTQVFIKPMAYWCLNFWFPLMKHSGFSCLVPEII